MRFIVFGFSLLICSVASAQNIVPDFPELFETIDNPIIKEGNYLATRIFKDQHNLVSHAYGYQTINGIEIDGANFSAHAQNGKVVAFHNSFIAQEHTLNVKAHATSQNTAFEAFIYRHAAHFVSKSISNTWLETSANHYDLVDSNLSTETIKMKRTYFMTDGGLVPTWSLSCLLPDGSHWYYSIINALNGEIEKEMDWMLHCSVNHNHSEHAFPSPAGGGSNDAANKKDDGSSYHVFAFPVESPNHGDRTFEKEPADEEASPFGWHDVNGKSGAEYTITRGNNVYASEDKNGDNEPGHSPDGGSALEFDFFFSDTTTLDRILDAAIVNLFYSSNVMHDVLWHYGFDEQSGNFQEKHYGNSSGGEGDPLNADAQDGSGTNNANFAAPRDGQSPRMQMFIWSPKGQAALDVLNPSSHTGTYLLSKASFGPALSNKPIRGKLVLALDASADSTKGCDSIINGDSLKGNIALIERGGNCNFPYKVQNAQDAGAIAVIVYTDSRPATEMSGSSTTITIPSVMINREVGLDLIADLATKSFEVVLYDSTGSFGFDSDFDNSVFAHEFAHGVSSRLTGGADNANCLKNQEQMGEGWSDFFALVMTHLPSHTATTSRGASTYSMGQEITGGGIRKYPYSTDTTISAYDYSEIPDAIAPHGVGAIWCAMLWEMYWALIDEYGFDPDLYNGTGGNNICIQLVIDGMKLQPCNPSFTDARDAIIQADKLNYDGKNEKLIWTAFAKRGLGYDADAGDPNSKKDGKAGYALPPSFSGLESIEQKLVTVYPNPGNGHLILNTTIGKIDQLLIKNITGQEVFRANNIVSTMYLDINNLIPGIYYFEIKYNKQTEFAKYIKI